MNAQSVSASLNRLTDSIKATFQQIGRLSKSTASDYSAEGEDTQLELVQDIRDALKQYEETLETLKLEVEDLTQSGISAQRRRDSIKDRERARLEAQVARLDEDLKHARNQFRRAQLTAKRTSEISKQKEREALFASIQESSQPASGSATPDLFTGRRQHQTKQLTQDDILVNASSDVTLALRRTHDLLTSELSRSRFAQETLDQSTAALGDLGERYGSLDTLLSNSKNLLGTLVRSQKSDTWYLETAFYILIVTICWLVFRRLIYGPAWWFIWLPLKYFFLKPFYFILTTIGLVGRASPESASTTATSVSRPSLRVHNSATGGIPRFSMEGDQVHRPAVPVGGGGRGAKRMPDGAYKDPSPDGSLSQKIGQMAEASRGDAQEDPNAEEQEDEPAMRGDGTILQERGDIPKNPKKRMMEHNVESDASKGQPRDEL